MIAIDASRAFLPKRTGIEEYSYQTIKALRKELAGERVILYMRKTTNNEQLTTDNEQRTTNNKQRTTNNEQRETDNFQQTMNNKQLLLSVGSCQLEVPSGWVVKELWGPRFWTQGRLAIEMLFHSPDVLFVPAHTVPWIHPKKTIVTIHGLEYEFCPEAYSWWDRWYMRFSIKNSCRWASKIITVSENTKRDLMKLYNVPEEKIVVVYEGIGGGELGIKNKELGEDSKFKISKPYFLFVGRIETRKNVARMIEAFEVFKEKFGTAHKLVLVGKPGFGYEGIKNQELRIKHAEDVVELGYVSDEEKGELLRNADGFLFPSLYEGFGLPVLEAQTIGVPVLTSNTSSLPEVAGNKSAVFVDPLNVEDIATGMEKLALDENFRSVIIKNGRENARRFNWEKCAKEIAELLKGK